MKRNLIYSFLCGLLFLYVSLTVSCSSGSKFKIDGHLLNMDQGEILVYSNTKLFTGLDTIRIQAGRFYYERRMEKSGTLVLVFPNFSEIPVFAEPGKSVDLKGNAQQLSDITINGTKDNEKFTRFKTQTKKLTPPEVMKAVEKFIKENAESPVSLWLLEKYMIKSIKPNYKKIFNLAKTIKEKQPDNAIAGNLLISLEKIKNYSEKGKLPSFSAKDIEGKTIDNSTLKGKKTIIYTSATWDYTNEIEGKTRVLLNENKDINIIKISIDPSKEKVKKDMEYQEKKPRVICDEKMFDSPLLKKLSLSSCGDCIIIDEEGEILARNIKSTDVDKYLE